MGSGGAAGGSAAKKAQRHRDMADRWQRGADGERLTAAALAPLGEAGFRVFHDLRVPGSKANIDHLLIGPTGVFAVDSKNHRSRLSYNKGTLWAGRYPQTEKLRRTRWEAEQAALALGGGAEVVAVQCVHGTPVPALEGPVEGVRVVDAAGLVSLVSGSGAVLTPSQCSELVASAVAVWSTWEPSSPRPRPAAAARPARRAPYPTAPSRPPARSRRDRRAAQPWWAALLTLVLALAFLWLAVTQALPTPSAP